MPLAILYKIVYNGVAKGVNHVNNNSVSGCGYPVLRSGITNPARHIQSDSFRLARHGVVLADVLTTADLM